MMGKIGDRHAKRLDVLREHLEEAHRIRAENVPVKRPLSEWKELWLNDLRIGNRSPRTLEVYENDLDHFIKSGLPFDALGVRKYLASLGARRSPDTATTDL